MREFLSYVKQLTNLLAVPADQQNSIWKARCNAALDGQPGEVLRRLVETQVLREYGAFFTGAALSQLAVKKIAGTLNENSVILDPACGAGDLLIACARHLVKRTHSPQTVKDWASTLMGIDLHESFVRATQLRLGLLITRIDPFVSAPVNRLFRNVKLGCGLKSVTAIRRATHIVINPPFTRLKVPSNCKWATGQVNAAALFLENCVVHASPGTRIVAILPDVLRSGRRYRKWRQLISQKCRIVSIERHDCFASWADVHVFILSMTVGQTDRQLVARLREWKQEEVRKRNTLGKRFEVSVGPVVHYRDPHEGTERAYLVSRGLASWKTIVRIRTRRYFAGRVLKPPFVVVRRTSRPEDKYRAVGTIVKGKRPVAVDNHLLILRPKDKTLKSCKAVLQILRKHSTTKYLNRRIRCRHLTVNAVAQLPWSL